MVGAVDIDDLTPVAQDYVKAIWAAAEWDSQPPSAAQLAERFGTSRAAVTDTVRRLTAQGLLTHEPYRPAELTDLGRRLALQMVRRHRLIETYLVEAVGYAWDEVHDEAERLEHAVSDLFLDRIDRLLEHPQQDPHGDPIPSADGVLPPLSSSRPAALADAEAGSSVTVVRVSDADPAVLGRAREHGLLPGARVTVGADALADEDLAAAVLVRPTDAAAD